MDRLISLNAVLSAIGEWIAHREYDYTNATEYLRNRIKAIPSAEPCEDAISRDAVLEKAVYTETEEGWWGYTVDVDYIKSLPPVTPNEEEMTIKYIEGYNAGFCHAQAIFQKEPKTGHWICGLSWKCSKCGYEDDRALGTDFCPHCGARMVEPQERSEQSD